ncbi:hypothetical protein V6N13_051330 [Hibiscus sabdariffa]
MGRGPHPFRSALWFLHRRCPLQIGALVSLVFQARNFVPYGCSWPPSVLLPVLRSLVPPHRGRCYSSSQHLFSFLPFPFQSCSFLVPLDSVLRDNPDSVSFCLWQGSRMLRQTAARGIIGACGGFRPPPGFKERYSVVLPNSGISVLHGSLCPITRFLNPGDFLFWTGPIWNSLRTWALLSFQIWALIGLWGLRSALLSWVSPYWALISPGSLGDLYKPPGSLLGSGLQTGLWPPPATFLFGRPWCSGPITHFILLCVSSMGSPHRQLPALYAGHGPFVCRQAAKLDRPFWAWNFYIWIGAPHQFSVPFIEPVHLHGNVHATVPLPSSATSLFICYLMDPELLSAMENLQFTEEEYATVVSETTATATDEVNDPGAAAHPIDSNLPPAPPEQPAPPLPIFSAPADISSTTNTGTGLATKVASNDIAAAAARGQSDTDDTAAVHSLKQPVVDALPRQQTVSAPLPKASAAPLATENTNRPERTDCPPPALSTGVGRGPKRTIQGRYEVCCPIQPKRARVLPHDSSTNGSSTTTSDSEHIAGESSLNSPTEVAGQPRRAS